MKIRYSTKSAGLKIYFDEILHLNIVDISDLTAVQSWKAGENNYWIQYYMAKGNDIKSQYNDIEKWKSILDIIDKI